MFIFGSNLSKICSSRAAVLPYTIVRDTSKNEWSIKFLVGIDIKSGEVTDTGGGVKKKTDLNNLAASLRELTEETKGIFENYITLDTLSTCVAATQSPSRRFPLIQNSIDQITYDIGGLSVIFAPIGNEWIEKAPILFNEAGIHPTDESYNELSSLVWVTESEFLNMTRGIPLPYTMWPRLQKFYSSIYTKELHDLLYIRYWWFTPLFTVEKSEIRVAPISSLAPASPLKTIITATVQYILQKETPPCRA